MVGGNLARERRIRLQQRGLAGGMARAQEGTAMMTGRPAREDILAVIAVGDRTEGHGVEG